MSIPVAIALGSNLGNRAAHLDWAVHRVRSLLDGLIVSSYSETEPVGVPADLPQHPFLNAAVVGHTELAPRAVLDELLAIEAERGRVRTRAGEPRPLDLDLILYGSLQIDEPGLVIPHPRFRGRRFVLEPLAEIAPAWIDPQTGLTIEELKKRATT